MNNSILKSDTETNYDSLLFSFGKSKKTIFLATTNNNFFTKKIEQKEGIRDFPN